MMDETETEGVMTVGERLREAREAKGLSVEDIAAQTRIPTRHLSSLETSEWDKLPAPTYSVGFAKNYAGAVGLDRTEIGDQLRAEMGGYGSPSAHPEIYEAVDPARTMPKGLVFAALGLLLLAVIGFTWLSNRSLESDEVAAEPTNTTAPAVNAVSAPPPPAPVTAGAVVLTATDAVWIEVRDGNSVLKQGQLAPGERYEVPATASAPVLTTGKPEALRVTVGSAVAPPVGPAGERVSRISLIGADLMRGPPAQPAANPAPPSPTARRARPAPPPAAQSAPPATPGEVNAAAPAPTQ